MNLPSCIYRLIDYVVVKTTFSGPNPRSKHLVRIKFPNPSMDYSCPLRSLLTKVCNIKQNICFRLVKLKKRTVHSVDSACLS